MRLHRVLLSLGAAAALLIIARASLACDPNESCMRCLASAFGRCIQSGNDPVCEARKSACQIAPPILGGPYSEVNRPFSRQGDLPSLLPSPSPTPNPPLRLIPVRGYLRAADIPPPWVGAYGVVAFRAKPTSASRSRLLMVCQAYKAYLPRVETIPPSVRPEEQMITIWPLDDP